MRAKKNRAKAVHIDARKKEQSKGGTSMGAERNKGDTQTCLQKGTEQRQYTSMLAERNRAMAVHIDACRKQEIGYESNTPGTW